MEVRGRKNKIFASVLVSYFTDSSSNFIANSLCMIVIVYDVGVCKCVIRVPKHERASTMEWFIWRGRIAEEESTQLFHVEGTVYPFCVHPFSLYTHPSQRKQAPKNSALCVIYAVQKPCSDILIDSKGFKLYVESILST